MDVQFTFNREKQSQGVSLKRFVSQLLSEFQPLAVKNQSLIINEVPADFYVHTDKNILALIIRLLFHSIASTGSSNCIRVNVKRYNSIVLFQLKNTNTSFTYAPESNWQKINTLAQKIGGCIIENQMKERHATIIFSFCSLTNAA